MTSCKHLLLVVCGLLAFNANAGQSADQLSDTTVPRASNPDQLQLKPANVPQDNSIHDNRLLSRYLWDTEGLGPIDGLARYMWDPEEQDAQKQDEEVAVYLWDKELGTGPEQTVARYLWDGETLPKQDTVQGFQDDESLALYLWHGDSQYQDSSPALNNLAEPQMSVPYELGKYLWNDADTYEQVASIGNPIIQLKTQDFIVVGKDIDQVRLQLKSMNAGIIEEFAVINAIGARLSRSQVVKIGEMPGIISVMQDEVVETAGLKYSAKGDAELAFQGSEVSWTLHNVGGKRMRFDQLDLNWPAANGQLEAVKINGKVVFTGSETGPATIAIGNAVLKKKQSSQITLVFAGTAASDQQAYEISATFDEGISLAYGYKRSLPIQGRRRDTFFPTLIDADMLHLQGITGDGVGVAIIDTGSWSRKSVMLDTNGEERVLAYYDALENRTTTEMSDDSGHGSHIVSILASSKKTLDLNGEVPGSYHGIAPDANLVVVRAFDGDGRGTYMNVIRAIAYVIAHKQEYDIRVLNLSFSAKPMSHYWQDPLNLAVMAAWKAGIVVVVSSGNSGPDPMTIGVPANAPYVLTVGAMTDHYTPDDLSDDYLATFSSTGPTMEGFLKPEIVAPGGHMMGQMSARTTLATEHPEFHDGFSYFLMSGTSQAAAVASGVAALILQENPGLSPDDVKCRMMASASAATRPDGSLAYSPLQQGTGLINAWDAVHNTASGCANQGLDLVQDLQGTQHFGGPANQDAAGNFYLSTTDDYGRDLSQIFNDGYVWDQAGLSDLAMIWNVAYSWNQAELSGNDNFWSQADFDANGYGWSMDQLLADGRIWDISQLQPQEPTSEEPTQQPGTGFIWDLAWANNRGALVNRNNGSGPGYVWDIGIIANANFNWNTALTESGELIWQVGYSWDGDSSDTGGQLVNMGSVDRAGFIWQLDGAENNAFLWNLNDTENMAFLWNLSDPENAAFLWNLSDAEKTAFLWNLSDSENTAFLWNLNESENAAFLWNLSDAEKSAFLWNLNNSENAAFLWNLSDTEMSAFLWNLNDSENTAFLWNLNDSENTAFLWNLSDPENAAFLWNLSDADKAAFLWNLSDTENTAFLWNLNDSENAAFLWNLSDSEKAAFLWNLSDTERTAFLWNLNDSENTAFLWNLNDSENTAFLWNLNDSENTAFLWNLNDSENTAFLWNLNGSENTAFLWNLNDSENTAFLWNLNDSENTAFLWNLNDSENTAFLWNLNDSENTAFLWNLNDSENTAFLWNLNDSENTAFLWNLNDSENTAFLWNLNDSENTAFLWNLNDSENTAFLWNLNDSENTAFLWNLNGSENTAFLWNLSDSSSSAFLWNLSNQENDGAGASALNSGSVIQWVDQE